MNLPEIKTLVADFDKLPKSSRQPTYLELCRYPRRRFEEICSRLLCFYFAPHEEHGLKDLFLSSFLEVISPNNKLPIFLSNVQIINEENSNGKRLDILIRSDDFVIGIENKVGADLYNPLNEYKERIDLYNKEQHVNFKVVLSLKKIVKSNERRALDINGFVNVTYHQFFSVVRKNIGRYITDSNTKFFLYANDFLQTMENMDNQTAVNPHTDSYFFDNSAKINSLIEAYKKYNDRIMAIQNQKLVDLQELLKQQTKKGTWYIWEKEFLGCHGLDNAGGNIGLECGFTATKENPLGVFNLHIVTWDLNVWKVYSEAVNTAFKGNPEQTSGSKTEKLITTLDNGTDEEIFAAVIEVYNFLMDIEKRTILTS